VTNVAFGGADLRTLFISSARIGLSAQQLQSEPLAGALFALELPTPGLPASMFGA
jgi:sugar lactone lactonase YvrE